MPDIKLFQRDPDTGLLVLQLGESAKVLTGKELLAQIIALAFLKNPGRDVFDPGEGSGVRQDIGQFNFTTNDELKLMVLQRARFVEQEVISRQTVGIGDATEKLKKLVVLDVAADAENARVVARVRVVNEAGDYTDVLV